MAVHLEDPGVTGPDDGAVARSHAPTPAAPAASADHGARVAQLAATLTFLAGVVNLVSAAMPAERSRLRAVRFLTPEILSNGAVVAVAALGVALILIAGGLRRRNRIAWIVVIVVLAASAFFHLVKGLDLVEVVIQAALAGWLAGQGRYFTGQLGPRERRRVIGPAIGVVVITLLYGLLGIWSNEPGLIGQVGLWAAVKDVAKMAVGLGSDLPLRGRFAEVFPPSVAALFWVGVLLVLLRALAPRRRVVSDPGPTAEELVASEDSLAYFATRDDRLAARDGAALVSYGVAGAVALGAGDPIGPPAELARRDQGVPRPGGPAGAGPGGDRLLGGGDRGVRAGRPAPDLPRRRGGAGADRLRHRGQVRASTPAAAGTAATGTGSRPRCGGPATSTPARSPSWSVCRTGGGAAPPSAGSRCRSAGCSTRGTGTRWW